MNPFLRLLPALSLTFLPSAMQAAPQWIWSSKTAGNNDTVWARTTVDIADVKGVRVQVSCDNSCEIWINGEFAGRSSEWASPAKISAGKFLRPGPNVIAIKGANSGGIAGLVGRVDTGGKNAKVLTESGPAWKLTAANPGAGWEKERFNDSQWPNAVVTAKLGDAPWGNVFSGGGGGGAGGVALAA